MDVDETEQLPESYADVTDHHGRYFNRMAVANNAYFEPVDEFERERLELMHQTLAELFNGRCIFPEQIDPGFRPRRVLDCGTGTADWAREVADQYGCEVLGVDLIPNILPPFSEGDLTLQIADLNDRFTFPADSFDFVQSRNVAGGLNANRWRSYVADIFRVLRPGGWCQMVELSYVAQSNNGTFVPREDFALCQWSDRYQRAMEQRRKNPRAGRDLRRWIDAAGFVDVETQDVMLPMCAWSRTDEWQYRVGMLNQEHVGRMLFSAALYPLTVAQGMPIDEFEVLVNQASQEATDPAFQPYFQVWVHIGRKPRPRRRR